MQKQSVTRVVMSITRVTRIKGSRLGFAYDVVKPFYNEDMVFFASVGVAVVITEEIVAFNHRIVIETEAKAQQCLPVVNRNLLVGMTSGQDDQIILENFVDAGDFGVALLFVAVVLVVTASFVAVAAVGAAF